MLDFAGIITSTEPKMTADKQKLTTLVLKAGGRPGFQSLLHWLSNFIIQNRTTLKRDIFQFSPMT